MSGGSERENLAGVRIRRDDYATFGDGISQLLFGGELQVEIDRHHKVAARYR